MLNFLLNEPDKEKPTMLKTILHSQFLRMKCEDRLHIYFRYVDILGFIADRIQYQDAILIDLDDAENAGSISSAIRLCNQKAAIVFIGQPCQQRNGFHLYRPSAFLQYPFDPRETAQIVSKLCREQNRQAQNLFVRNHECIERIPYDNIEYFESADRKVTSYTNSDSPVYAFYAKIENVAKGITSGFFFGTIKATLSTCRMYKKVTGWHGISLPLPLKSIDCKANPQRGIRQVGNACF